MDRCRCDDYAKAVKELNVWTPGTHRSDVLAKVDRSRYVVWWRRHGVEYSDRNFVVPRARHMDEKYPTPSEEQRKAETMWCPYMTPVRPKTS